MFKHFFHYHHSSGNNDGIYLYDKFIYLHNLHHIPNFPQTYKVRFSVEENTNVYKENPYSEKIEVIETFNIHDYLIHKNNRLIFDFETFISDFIEISYIREIEDRVNRFNGNFIPERQSGYSMYYDDSYTEKNPVDDPDDIPYEFLEFNERTHSGLGGSFTLNGKHGGKIKIKETLEKYQDRNTLIQESFLDRVHEYHIPSYYKHNGIEVDLWKMSEEEKLKLFNDLPLNIFHETYKNVMRDFNNKESLMNFLPHSIYLFGNDDASYTKWFYSNEDVEKELLYLRKMQPLDLYKDFIDRGYVFTN